MANCGTDNYRTALLVTKLVHSNFVHMFNMCNTLDVMSDSIIFEKVIYDRYSWEALM